MSISLGHITITDATDREWVRVAARKSYCKNQDQLLSVERIKAEVWDSPVEQLLLDLRTYLESETGSVALILVRGKLETVIQTSQ